MARMSEERGQQGQQIRTLTDNLQRVEAKIDKIVEERQPQMIEWQDYKGRVHNLEKLGGTWELFQVNYQGIENKLNGLTASVAALTAARTEEQKTRSDHLWALIIACAASLITLAVTVIFHLQGTK